LYRIYILFLNFFICEATTGLPYGTVCMKRMNLELCTRDSWCRTDLLGSMGGLSNTKNSVNAVFIPTVDHQDFVTTQREDLASPHVVSLREGLGIRDGPTGPQGSWSTMHILFLRFLSVKETGPA